MSAGHTPMALAAGRALADRSAALCNVNAEDNWKVYSEDFIADAEAALKAAGAPDLLEALRELESMAERYHEYGYPIPDAQKKARAAIAKATGAKP